MSFNDISKLQSLLKTKIISSEDLGFSLPRELKEKSLMIAFNFIFHARIFFYQSLENSLDSFVLSIEETKEIIIAAVMLVMKYNGDCNEIQLIPLILEYSVENQINFHNVINIEMTICNYLEFRLTEITAPREFFEILFQYLNMKLSSYDKDLLLDFYDNLFDELIFKNLKILLKFNLATLSVSMFYYALLSIEDTIQIEPFKNFILALLISPATSFNELQENMNLYSEKELDCFSKFFSKINCCCNDIYEYLISN